MRDEIVVQAANPQPGGITRVGGQHGGAATDADDERVRVAVGGVLAVALKAQQDREEAFEVVDDGHSGLA